MSKEYIKTLKAKASRQGLPEAVYFVLDNLSGAIAALEVKVEKMEKDIERNRDSNLEANKDCKDLLSAICVTSDKVDATRDALKSHAAKMDAEDVTNLDTDYETTVVSSLGTNN